MTLPRDASYDRRYFIRLTTGPLDGPVIKAQKDSIHAFTKKNISRAFDKRKPGNKVIKIVANDKCFNANDITKNDSNKSHLQYFELFGTHCNRKISHDRRERQIASGDASLLRPSLQKDV